MRSTHDHTLAKMLWAVTRSRPFLYTACSSPKYGGSYILCHVSKLQYKRVVVRLNPQEPTKKPGISNADIKFLAVPVGQKK